MDCSDPRLRYQTCPMKGYIKPLITHGLVKFGEGPCIGRAIAVRRGWSALDSSPLALATWARAPDKRRTRACQEDGKNVADPPARGSCKRISDGCSSGHLRRDDGPYALGDSLAIRHNCLPTRRHPLDVVLEVRQLDSPAAVSRPPRRSRTISGICHTKIGTPETGRCASRIAPCLFGKLSLFDRTRPANVL